MTLTLCGYELSVYDVPMSNRVIWTSVCLLVRWREGEINILPVDGVNMMYKLMLVGERLRLCNTLCL